MQYKITSIHNIVLELPSSERFYFRATTKSDKSVATKKVLIIY